MTTDDTGSKTDKNRLPEHIAIIMDGNGRWAKSRRLPRIAGHRAGVKTVDKIVAYCREIGIKNLTLYSFSSENWSRPEDEVGALMKILKEFVVKELKRMLKEDIRLTVIGRFSDIPSFAREAVADAMKKTAGNRGMTLNLALSYGARDEITRAMKKIGREIADGTLTPDEIDENKISSCLDTKGLPDPDLLIRTSGEERISNFMLWQIAYTELYFANKLWPDFEPHDIAEAILSYQQRERRYGKTTEQLTGKRG